MIAFSEENKMTTIILNYILLYLELGIGAVLKGTDSAEMLMYYTLILEIKSHKLHQSSLLTQVTIGHLIIC